MNTIGNDRSDAPAVRSSRNAKAVRNRLARIIGHLRAITSMLDNDRDCAEILIQLSAVQSALNNTCKVLLKDHMDQCISAALSGENAQAMEDLRSAVDLMFR